LPKDTERFVGALLQQQREPEDAALTEPAVDAYLATHERNQLTGYGQAQTSAAISPRGRSIRLGES
jgi:hypothetical protein